MAGHSAGIEAVPIARSFAPSGQPGMSRDWDAIRAKNPLVEVIGKDVALKQHGNEWKGLCPFHAEKSPSFHVIPDKGFFHCFGCSAHGDVVDYVAASQGISIIDALAQLDGGAVKLTPVERQERAAIMAEREAAQAKERAEATAKAIRRWDRASPAPDDNAYLARKGVPAHDCRQEGSNLLLPIYGPDGDMQSIQTITPDGGKLFHKAAPTKAGRNMIGVHMGRTIIAEGFATAASIHDAVPDQVCVAYSKGNMHVIARELSGQGVAIVLAADSNAADEMRVLGAELDCPVIVPCSNDPAIKDFNDLAQAQGVESVAACFAKGMKDYAAAKAGAPAKRADGLPFDISGIDLKAPPGFVGEVARWIESQGRRPRMNLAVASAIAAVGNIAGLRHVDDLDGVTANTFVFCVAGSRTGKEAIQQALLTLHRSAGIIAATHGNIKSEQEIVRNLTRHQAAFYVVDEIGIMLQKIKSAQQRGGAAYLEGVIGLLMSAYSKADGFMALSGDVKEDVRKGLLAEGAQLQRKLDDGGPGAEYATKRLASVTQALGNLDNGLERPFLSMIGFTTPVTFDDLVDYQTATNGFIGRALLFNERDTAPRSKRRGFAKESLPESMAMRLAALYAGGTYEAAGRVEHYGDIVRVPSTPEAVAMMDAALEWYEDQAIAHKGQSGLESLFLGAYELMSKVSLILACGDGERTPTNVAWAFALIRRDVEEKMRLVTANDRAKDSPTLALEARIANVISSDDGETVSVICNRIRGHKRDEIEAALENMESAGVVEHLDTGAKYKGKPVVKLRFCG